MKTRKCPRIFQLNRVESLFSPNQICLFFMKKISSNLTMKCAMNGLNNSQDTEKSWLLLTYFMIVKLSVYFNWYAYYELMSNGSCLKNASNITSNAYLWNTSCMKICEINPISKTIKIWLHKVPYFSYLIPWK